MFKIPSRTSVFLSLALSVALFCVCIFGAFFMPEIADMLVEAKNSMPYENISEQGRTVLVILGYIALCVIVLADALLFCLLLRVRNSKVFTAKSVALIRSISWCCILLCLVLCGISVYFALSLVVALAAAFLGLCVRVVKNVIEQATEIKSENDLTV